MRKIIWVIGFWVALLSFFSCTNTSLEELTRDDCDTCQTVICDTSFTVSYANDIRTITAEYCDKCHSALNGPIFGSGNVLDNYNGLADYASNGILLCSIKHEAGCSPMPENDPKLSDCHIARIEAWVRQGYPNN